MPMRRRVCPRVAVVLCFSLILITITTTCRNDEARAQTHSSSNATSVTGASAAEERAARAFETARANKADGVALAAFLEPMPKGADLHMHLSGAVYAETFLKDGAEDHICANQATLSFASSIPADNASPEAKCPQGDVPVSTVFSNQKLYDALIDSFSMRSFVPTSGFSGHDQFFATFDRFNLGPDADARHGGEWLDELANRAASQNEQYLEIMQTPSNDIPASIRLGNQFGWPATPAGSPIDPRGDATGTSRAELQALRSRLLASGLHEEAMREQSELDRTLADRNRIEHCGQADAAAACAVKIRFLYQVLRAFPPQVVFVEALMAFEVASADPNVVGLNFVQPEDSYLAMSEYNRQMHMLDYLHSVYPQVHISLHAGELAPGLVPPAGLRFHIREAIDLGHAERIGHGVDVMHETDPHALLREMADRHIMVEINLTSNAVILGIVPPFHPLPEYREAHVPVALSTDDEGVSRIDLTHEYVRAVMEYGLNYSDLKAMARTSIEHSFLPGPSLWEASDVFTRTRPACAGQVPGAESPTGSCLDLLRSSQKAAEEWELEHRFAVFEAGFR
jgi:adenosine deaminase